MNILILGSGAREHALAWKLKQSPLAKAVCVAPGNAGIALDFACSPVDPTQAQDVLTLARSFRADLIVIGPEAPLVAGVADDLRAHGFLVFGPSQAASQIESSKAFAKEIMLAAGIPTASYRVFSNVEEAKAHAKSCSSVVVKVDGLAAGKGVVVAHSSAEAVAAVESLADLPGGTRFILEEVLLGPELSVMALCDGTNYRLLPPARDHKRIFDGDRGPNTGGMGAVASAELYPKSAYELLGREVIAPALLELQRRGTPFIGALYAGLMLTPEGPKVLEYNCRLGDPETQVLMQVVTEDVLPTLMACAQQALPEEKPVVASEGTAIGIVLASFGYPQSPRLGDVINGLTANQSNGDVVVFAAGVAKAGSEWVTSGGRVATVCSRASDLSHARDLAYRAVEKVTFPGRHYRSDIGMTVRR